MRCGVAVSLMEHTGQSEAIHSPEAWARTVLSLYTASPYTASLYTAGPYTAGPYTAGPYTAGPYTAGAYTAGPYTAGEYTATRNRWPMHNEPVYSGHRTASISF